MTGVQTCALPIFTTVSWLLVTYLTKPTDSGTLKTFFRRVHPDGWWEPIVRMVPEVQQDTGYARLLIDWAAGVILTYSVLFGLGKCILGDWQVGVAYLFLAAAAGAVLFSHFSKIGWEKVTE